MSDLKELPPPKAAKPRSPHAFDRKDWKKILAMAGGLAGTIVPTHLSHKSDIGELSERVARVEGKLDAVLELHAQQERETKAAHAASERPPSEVTPTAVVAK